MRLIAIDECGAALRPHLHRLSQRLLVHDLRSGDIPTDHLRDTNSDPRISR